MSQQKINELIKDETATSHSNESQNPPKSELEEINKNADNDLSDDDLAAVAGGVLSFCTVDQKKCQ